MKFIQTLHFDISTNPFKYTFGWASPEYHLISWALSCLQLNKVYGNVELYASSSAAKLLIKDLGLPYNKVHKTHDEFYLPNKKLWALSKIHTYSLQNTPFLHIDGDVFIFKKFPDSLLAAELIAQNLEEATDYYKETQKELMHHFTFFPKCVKKDFNSSIPISAINAGILGGNNISFIQKYAKSANEYVQRNEVDLSKIDADKFNVFFEQHLFYSMAAEKNIPINVLINERVKDNQYNNLSNFHEVSLKENYIHLLGHYKRDEFTCVQMAATLRELYPEYYYKIISLFKNKNIPLFNPIYQVKNITSINEQKEFKEISLKSYTLGLTEKNNEITIEIKCQELERLKDFTNNFKVSKEHNFTQKELKKDFTYFFKTLNNLILSNQKIPSSYLYGRDLDCITWYHTIFKKDNEIQNILITKCEDISVFKSKFDWARILKSYNVEGREYYKIIDLFSNEFYNLVVPELSDRRYNLFDLDEIENIILEHLAKPLLIKDLFGLMYQYVEEDIIKNHLKEYHELLIVMLKQLVLKKAIKPTKVKVISIE